MIDNQIQQFQHEEFGAIRAIEIDGEPWFVGKDVAASLGYSRPDHAINNHVDSEDRLMYQIDTSGQSRNMLIINESGLYSLILSSKLPTAKKFRRWVTATILPAIRRSGTYFSPDAFAHPEQLAALCRGYLTAIAENDALAPKAKYYDIILQSRNCVQTSIIAKDYGMSAVTFNRLLHDLRIQYRMGPTWLLYQEYANQGYTKTRTYQASERTSVIHTYWTQKGRLFLYDRLKQEGIIPRMEADNPAAYLDGGGDCP